MGITHTCLRSFGKTPVWSERFINLLSEMMSSWLQNLINLFENASGPQDFLLFSLPSSLFISFWSTGVKNMMDWVDLIKYFVWLLFADVLPDNLLTIMAKCWFKVFTISKFAVIGLLSIINFPMICFFVPFSGVYNGTKYATQFLQRCFCVTKYIMKLHLLCSCTDVL